MMKSGVRNAVFLFFSLTACLILIVFSWLPGRAQSSGTSQPTATAQAQGTTTYKVYLPITAKNPLPSAGMPLVSTSLYMYTKDQTKLVNEGCALGKRDLGLPGKQDSVVVLAFGYPQKSAAGVYGTRGFGYPPKPWTMTEITAAAENFGYGYWKCVGEDFDSHLRIAIGTNNFQGDTTPAVNAGHGKAWANMVAAVNDWFVKNCERSCDGQVDAVGANDIELAWNTYTATADWLNGYASVTKYPLYNFGAIEGCPWLARPSYTCAWGSVEKVWYVVWGSDPVQPIPEIYANSGVNAEQWYLMSVYSYEKHHEKIQFVGPMTETQACAQEGGCPGIEMPPADAWHLFYNLLNGDPRTAGERLPYLTDIKWLGR